MMRKTWIVLLSMLLLIATGVSSAGATDFDPNSAPPWSAVEYNSDTDEVINYSAQSSNAADSGYNGWGLYADDYQGISSDSQDTTSYSNSALNPQIIDWSGDPLIVPIGEEVTTTSSGTQTLDWYGTGFDLINANKNITVYDINTGVSWSATYINGKNHADVIPASQEDNQKLTSNNITGSYVRRPVLVTIAGTQYAGSMYAVGHGDTSYCSYFKGVMCIHFTGSQTHGSSNVDSDHQSAIGDALSYGNGG